MFLMKSRILRLVFLLIINLCFANKNIDIVFFHDVHSFLDKAPKVKTLIDEKIAENPSTFIFDAGDFSMGTLFQTVYETQASELRVLGKLGVDATTLGNHEFDYGLDGIKNMLNTAYKNYSHEDLPSLVLCNLNKEKDNQYTQNLKEELTSYVKDYIVVEKGNIKIAVLGVFGKNAFECIPSFELEFYDQYEAVKNTVKKIQETETVDMIICLSHCGTSETPSLSEDEILAKKVPELDLIISAHSHTTLTSPITIGDTHIVSSGPYFENLGTISLEQDNNRWKIKNYELKPIHDGIKDNLELKNFVSSIEKSIDQEYLSLFGYTKNDVLINLQNPITSLAETGYLMSDAIAFSLHDLDLVEKKPFDVVVVPEGIIRGTFDSSEVTVSKVFTNYSLGIGPDGITGYPLVIFYLTGKELKIACEVDCSLAKLKPDFKLYFTGISYEFNKNRLILNRVTNVYKRDSYGKLEPINPDGVYGIVSDIYTAEMIGNVISMTKGLIKIAPKDEHGNIITNFKDEIVYYKDDFGNVREVKGWHGIANYFEKTDSIQDYSEIAKISILEKNSLNPIELIKAPSLIGLILYGIILLIFVILLLSIILIAKILKKRKGKK